MNIIFRPSDCLTQVVGSCGKAVVATRKVGKAPHRALSVFPDKPEIDIADVVRRTVETRGIFHVPCDAAVRSAECVEVGEQTVSPQSSMPVPIRQSGIACHPGLVI